MPRLQNVHILREIRRYGNLGVQNILQSACEVISNIPRKYSVRVIDKYNVLYTSWKHCVQFTALYVRVRNRNDYQMLL